MDSFDVLQFARKYRDWGWAIQAQFDEIMDGGDTDDLNGNAVEHMWRDVKWLAKPDDDTPLGQIVYEVKRVYDDYFAD